MAPRNFTDPGMDAYGFVESVADEHGDENTDDYIGEFVEAVMELHPAVKERFFDAVLTDLIEEVVRVEDPKYSRAVVQLIEDIKADRDGERS